MIHPWHTLRYLAFIVSEIVTNSAMIARDVFTPGLAETPLIVEYPLIAETDAEIALMASSITITPGTLTLGIAPAGSGRPATLFVHAMYGTRESVLAELTDMERRLLLATRGPEAVR